MNTPITVTGTGTPSTPPRHAEKVKLASAAAYYFGSTPRQAAWIRRFLKQNDAKIVTAEDMRSVLNVHYGHWYKFVSSYAATLLIRQRGHAALHRVQIQAGNSDIPLPAGVSVGKPTPLSNATPSNTAPASTNEREMLTQALEANKELAEAVKTVQAKLDVAEEKCKVKQGPIDIVIKKEGSKETIKITKAHFMLPKLLTRVKAGLHVYLVGPAGSGKTTAAEQAAKALDLKFGFMSVGPQTTTTSIYGYMNATGDYVATEFRRRYEHGGVFLFDEMDAANAGVLTSVNGALSGDCAGFPDRMVPMHKDFRCVGAGNTFGTGPDRQYVGRQELDAASLDRFNLLEWPYDEGLELAIAEAIDKRHAREWVPYVQAVRKAVNKLAIRHVVSPRASINGVKLLAANEALESVQTTQLWKNLKPAEITRITAAMVGGAS